MIYGPNNSVNGPHIQTFTSSDNFPLLQVMSLQHNMWHWDLIPYDGTGYLSSNSGSNFVLGKVSNSFQLLCGSGATQGTTPTLSVASSWDASGNFTCNQNFNGTKMSWCSTMFNDVS